MDEDSDDVPDTRVFVSGLPPKYTSDQLGAHFAGRYQITDAVVLPGRQIGFVGFRNYTLAKNAVKYFDRTYIRMSKISVSMAKPVEMNRSSEAQAAPESHPSSSANELRSSSDIQSRSGKNATSPSTSFAPYVPVTKSSTSTKRKRDENGDVQGQQGEALKEFLSVMQPSKRSALAAQEPAVETSEGVEKKVRKDKKKKHGSMEVDGLGGGSEEKGKEKTKTKTKKASGNMQDGTSAALSTIHTAGTEGGEREERRRQKKEKRRQEKLIAQDEEVGDRTSTKEPQAKKSRKGHNNAEGGVEPIDEDAFGVEKNETDVVQPSNAKSDSDWLRAKTSRTLDLVGPQNHASPSKHADEHDSSARSQSDSDSSDSETSGHHEKQSVPVRASNGRLFVRNLPFTTTEEELRKTFSKCGKLAEVHLVRDFKTSTNKGLAYLQFVEPQSAEAALREMDGKSFQGRLIHLLPAFDKKSTKLDEFELSKLPLKTQKALKRKADASTSAFSWNSLYMNPDAVLSSVADRLGVDKSELLDPTSSDAGVKQAFAETDIIKKTKDYLRDSGVDIEAFKSRERDDRTLLLKNFSYGTTSEELRNMLEPFGQISKFILPPSGTMAIVQYGEKCAASQALRQLAYKNLKGSVLFLEKGPLGLFKETPGNGILGQGEVATTGESLGSLEEQDQPQSQTEASSSTVFVRNLNFSTTTKELTNVFQPLAGFKSARVKTRTDPKRPGEILSMGFGFVEFATKSQAQSAISVMSGHRLDGHDLQVQASHKATDAAEERRREDKARKTEGQRTKIIIKNLPFEASKKDIRTLFGAYGQLRTVRVPKKFDNSTRGFAFAEFVTAKEAQNAIEALTNTHLLGRRLVLDFAEGESIDPEEEIAAIEKKVGRQSRMVDLNKMTGSARRKFNVDARDDIDTI